MSSEKRYYGETICQGKSQKGVPCSNKAYYKSGPLFVCGVHSRKNENRVKLPVNPNAGQRRQERLEERQVLVKNVAQQNKELDVKGRVILSKLRMMKEPEHNDGFLKVFPNFKHGHREDVFGCATLSPKSMGPIEH